MSRKVDTTYVLLCARFLLFMAAVMPLLFLGNLRSRLLYKAPNLSSLFLISCAYCFLQERFAKNSKKREERFGAL